MKLNKSRLKYFKIITTYSLTALAMFLAIGLCLALIPILGSSTSYLTVFPAIALTGVIAGTGPALCAAILAFSISEAWAFGPIVDLIIWPRIIRASATLITGFAVGYLSNKLKIARDNAEKQAAIAKSSEEQLRRTTELLTTILETTPDFIYAKDKEGELKIASPSFINFLKKASTTPLEFDKFNLPKDGVLLKYFTTNEKTVLDDGHFLTFEEVIELPKSSHYFLSSKGPLRNTLGDIIGTICISRDITERKLTENKLRESEERFRIFMDNSPLAVWMVDRQGRYLYVNKTYYKTFSVQKTDLTGLLMKDVHSDYLYSIYKEQNDLVFSSGESVHIVTPGIRINNKQGDYLMHKFLIPRSNGEVTLGGIAADITDILQNEKDLRLAKEAAEAANNAKLNFLATMSHELRTPLNAILGFSELLGEPNLTIIDRIELAVRVKRNGEMLTRLIGEILDLSKIESGKIDLEYMEINPKEMLHEVIGVLSQQALKKGLVLNFKLQEPVPEIISTDPTRLRQILTNIIGNAIKFTTTGSVQVTLSADLQKGQAQFLIEDSGEGIKPENIEKLFEPFFQADSSHTRRFGGTGLGLNISRKIARALGGDVTLISSSLRGSTFLITIALPKIKFKENPTLSMPRTSEPALERHPLEGVHILVTDDSTDNLLLVSRLLGLQGAIIETAISGQEALEKVATTKFDIILMDIQMPGLDGFAVTRILRQQGFQHPIIALTAHAMSSDREKSLQSGFDDHVVKPFDKKDLVTTILKHLPRKDLNPEPSPPA